MEFSFELTPQDYPQHQRLTGKFPWAAIIAVALVLPSLVALYLGGYRVALAVVAGLLALLLIGSFRAAAALKRRSFLEDLCTPQTVRVCEEHLEIDGVIEWRRIDWSYLEQVEQRDGWVKIELFEGQPLTFPPRAFGEGQREQLVACVRQAIADAKPHESSQLPACRELADLPQAEVEYTIDNNYMRSLVELRFHGRGGWTRLLLMAVVTAVGCKVWPNYARQIAAVGAAIILPMIGLRIMEWAFKRSALRRAQLEFEVPMRLTLHEDGYQIRCRLFQSFTSWLLVTRMQVARPFVLISLADHEHQLIPLDAWPDGQADEFCELGHQLRQQRMAEESDEESGAGELPEEQSEELPGEQSEEEPEEPQPRGAADQE